MRFHVDENVSAAIVDGMRHKNLDVTATLELGMDGFTDEEQLAYCLSEKRIILTSDTDFLKLQAKGIKHTGIIFIPQTEQLKVGKIVKFCLNIIATETAETMNCRLIYFR